MILHNIRKLGSASKLEKINKSKENKSHLYFISWLSYLYTSLPVMLTVDDIFLNP